MSNFIGIIISLIIYIAVLYFIGSVIAWDTDPANWSGFGRFILLILFIIGVGKGISEM